MSGVSITSGTPDLDAIARGGTEFLSRLQTFKDAKDAADKARADLGLAKDAKAALEEAQTILAAAKEQADQIIAKAEAKAAAADRMMERSEAHKTKLYEDLRQLAGNVQKAANA
jgi:hypothetical protein